MFVCYIDFMFFKRLILIASKSINTPRAHHNGQQSLIECAKLDFKIMYFPFFYVYYFFGVNKGVALAPTYPQVR